MEALYEWIRGIAYYLILVTAVFQVLAGRNYHRYVRLFTGIILIVLILKPFAQVMGMTSEAFWEETVRKYDQTVNQMKEKVEELEEEALPETELGKALEKTEQEEETGQIGVGEVQIGREK